PHPTLPRTITTGGPATPYCRTLIRPHRPDSPNIPPRGPLVSAHTSTLLTSESFPGRGVRSIFPAGDPGPHYPAPPHPPPQTPPPSHPPLVATPPLPATPETLPTAAPAPYTSPYHCPPTQGATLTMRPPTKIFSRYPGGTR